jgi:hypothetical protein
VLAQAAFLSQGVDAHSSISIKCQKIDVNRKLMAKNGKIYILINLMK